MKRTVTLVFASTALGFVGDVMTYSVAASKGSKLRLAFPRGKELFTVLAIGIISGIVLDRALVWIEDSLKTPEERALDELVGKEKEKIYSGIIKNEKPVQVEWAKI